MLMEFGNFKISLFDPSQSEAFFELIDSNKSRLDDFFAGTVAKTQTLEDTINYCELIAQKIIDKTYLPYIISDKRSNAFIGLIDLKNIDWNVPKAELGYFVDSNHEGKGLITKALGLVVSYLLKEYKFSKLLCRVGSQNTGSINVALKNGFQLEGTIRNDYRTTKGEIVDLNYYGRVF